MDAEEKFQLELALDDAISTFTHQTPDGVMSTNMLIEPASLKELLNKIIKALPEDH